MRKVLLFILFTLLIPYYLWAVLPDQVMIEVKVVEVSTLSGKEIGVRWGYDRERHTISPIASDYYSETTGPKARRGGEEAGLWQGELDFLHLNWDKGVDLLFDKIKIGKTLLDARIQALIQEGKAKLLANPRIVTINGKKATIISGREIPFQTTKLVSTRTVLTTEFKTAGVTLSVTPTIQEEDFILLDVEPEVSGVIGHEDVIFGNTSEGPDQMMVASLPVFSTRKAKTQVLVKNGGTLVIGGLYQNNLVKDVEKVPFLGSIPILGLLFRKTDEKLVQSELLIFITPRIIRPGEGVVIPRVIEKEKEKEK
ncbi:hypothetical protein J7K43_04215 [Candidatus Calescamantes bacterium]|nr:hypothetical protein [Candidatus Calescamantes bacterium]